jgi:hypothetical protein
VSGVVSNLARNRFLNGLRILHSIDEHELASVGLKFGEFGFTWESFRDDPARALMMASDYTADRIYSIIERRQPDRLKTEGTWRPIDTVPKGDEIFMAATADNRIMIFRGSILANMMKKSTPDHLQFPAIAWMPLPEPPK